MTSIFNFTSLLNSLLFLPPSLGNVTKKLLEEPQWLKKFQKIGNRQIPCLKYCMTFDKPKKDEEAGLTQIKSIDIIYFHGNAENIFLCWERVIRIVDCLTDLSENENLNIILEIRIFVPEYPGYLEGDCSENSISIIDEWCDCISHEICYSCNDDPANRIVLLWGYSLGSGFATKVMYFLEKCDHTPPYSVPHLFLILEAPFISIKHTAKTITGFFERQLCNFFWNENLYEYFPTGSILTGLGHTNPDWKKYIYCAQNDNICGSSIPKFNELYENFKVIDHFQIFQGWNHIDFQANVSIIFKHLWNNGLKDAMEYEFLLDDIILKSNDNIDNEKQQDIEENNNTKLIEEEEEEKEIVRTKSDLLLNLFTLD